MDSRRFLTLVALGLSLCGCAILRPTPTPSLQARAAPSPLSATAPARPLPVTRVVAMAPIANPPDYGAGARPAPSHRRLRHSRPGLIRARRRDVLSGPAAIAAANAEARTASRSDEFVGGVQVFSYEPGKVYEVWAAPLRVTTLTLPPGETIISKAAGDTVRWQIGETKSGVGPSQRVHVLLKPLKRGLETNLVITTNQRIYMVQLKSGAPEAFNAAVAWDVPPSGGSRPQTHGGDATDGEPVATPSTPVDAHYRIAPRGRRPRWTPTAVMNDGAHTFITFAPDLQVDEAPTLFLIAPDGEQQMVNYRQQGGVFVVDRVFDRAELRLGDRDPQVVRIERVGASS